MGDSLDDELAALRARAYGADADIHHDPDALARLRTLEDEHRARRTAVPPVPPAPGAGPARNAGSAPPEARGAAAAPASTAASDAPVGATGAPAGGATPASAPVRTASARIVSDAEAPATASPDSPDGPRAPRSRPTWRALVAACAVTAALGAAVAVPVTLWAERTAERPYAVLTPAVGEPDGVFFSPESNPIRFEDFLGIEISVGGLDYLEGERCILVNPDPSTEAFDEGSNTRGSCSPAGFNAVVDLPAVDGYLSDEVRRELGDITALRFELVGDEVHVFVARVPEDTDRS